MQRRVEAGPSSIGRGYPARRSLSNPKSRDGRRKPSSCRSRSRTAGSCTYMWGRNTCRWPARTTNNSRGRVFHRATIHQLAAGRIDRRIASPSLACRAAAGPSRSSHVDAAILRSQASRYFMTAEQNGHAGNVQIGAIGVADTPIRLTAAESVVQGKAITEAIARQAGAAASESVHPADDIHAPGEYRRALIGVLTELALARASGLSLQEHA